MGEILVLIIVGWAILKFFLPLAAFKYMAQRAYGSKKEDKALENFFWTVRRWDTSATQRLSNGGRDKNIDIYNDE